jgi:hypothetical protein
LYPRRSWEELGGMFLGRLADLEGKPEGDKSMPGKRWPSGGVQGGVPQDPRDMAKAGLLEAQSPAVNVRTLRNDAWNRCRVMPWHESVGWGSPRDAGRRPVRAVKEMSGRPVSRSIRTTGTYRGIAYGARALWRRSARSSRRSNDLPQEAGKAGPQGEGAQVI